MDKEIESPESHDILELIYIGFWHLSHILVGIAMLLFFATLVGMAIRGRFFSDGFSIMDTGLGILVFGGIILISYMAGKLLMKIDYMRTKTPGDFVDFEHKRGLF